MSSIAGRHVELAGDLTNSAPPLLVTEVHAWKQTCTPLDRSMSACLALTTSVERGVVVFVASCATNRSRICSDHMAHFELPIPWLQVRVKQQSSRL